MVTGLLSDARGNAGTPRPATSSAVIAQRALAVDDAPIVDANALPPDVTAAFETSRTPPEIRERILRNAIVDTGADLKLTAKGLVELVDEVAARLQTIYSGGPPPPSVNHNSVRLAERVSQDTIASSLKVKGKPGPRFRFFNIAQSLKTHSAMALGGFLEMHPDFKDSLKSVSFNFLSAEANKLGGLYQDNTVHIEADRGQQSPEVFMRLLLHEIGHATFQKMLLNVRDQPLGEDAAKDKPGKSTEVDELAKELEGRIAPLNADGKALYDAWMTLKNNGGQNLFVVGLGSVGDLKARRDYQIGSFNEFCAETFMHVVNAGAAWKEHVQAMLENPEGNVPEEHQQAWRTIVDVMDRYVPQITGRTRALAMAGQ